MERQDFPRKCKKKWRLCETKFVRELKKVKHRVSGDEGPPYVPSWEFFYVLSFLMDSVKQTVSLSFSRSSGGSLSDKEKAGDCNLVNSRYRYMADLLALDRCRPHQSTAKTQPAGAGGFGPSTINLPAWRASFLSYPDSRDTRHILRGLENRFRIGFDYHAKTCRPARRNMKSARDHETVINSYLDEEKSRNRLLVMSDETSSDQVQISPFGVIPKPHQPGRWRIIVDLFVPRGASVNDGIDSRLCSLSYVRVDKAAERVMALRRGSQLAKLDVQSAYRIVPVHPDDWSLLGVCWQGTVLLDLWPLSTNLPSRVGTFPGRRIR